MTLSAPYNFVPISEKVCTADDLGLPAGRPTQDDPVTGGLCGEIEITLTANAPILVAGAQGSGEKRFFKTPEGNAIPGSTLRGMIRNVIEIASFGRMWRVENRRFGMRDLDDSARLDYGSRMSTNHGNKIFEAQAHGGWLIQTGEGLFLEEVAYGRIEHSDLFGKRRPDKRTAMELEDQYEGPNPRQVYIEDQPGRHPHSNGKTLVYKKAYGTGAAGRTKVDAEIVFTGMPNEKKHLEFAFPQPTGTGIQVPKGVWEKFIDVHENLEKKSPTWIDRRSKLRAGHPIAVFFLLKENETEFTTDTLDQIGLSMMFKMAGDNTTHQMMPAAHRSDAVIDLATRMFGRISRDHGSFRGRLSFGIMEQSGDAPLLDDNGKWLILSSPKPSYYPAYVRQRDLRDATHLHEQAQYRSYMNWTAPDGSPGRSDTIRGWKRYPIPKNAVLTNQHPAISNAGNNSASRLYPLASGAMFTGKIRFHNLHEIELGALLWALEWGGETNCFHSVGMGKPFGWGKSRVLVNSLKVDNEASQVTGFVEKFMDAMEHAIPGWNNSPQINSLLAMARACHGADVIGQMELKGFRFAKANREVLPDIRYQPDIGLDHSRMKRELTKDEALALGERREKIAERQAKSGVKWVTKGSILRAKLEIDGKFHYVKGQAQEDQTTEAGVIHVYFGEEIGFQRIPRSELEVIE